MINIPSQITVNTTSFIMFIILALVSPEMLRILAKARRDEKASAERTKARANRLRACA